MSFKSLHHTFDIHIAEIYGVKEAILIHHFQHWIQINRNKGINEHEGSTWTYQTLEDIAANFPYWTKSQIQDLIERLCTGRNRKSNKKDLDFQPVLKKGNFNRHPYDRTIWYAFIDQENFTVLGNPKMAKGRSQKGEREIPTPIPDTKPYTKPLEEKINKKSGCAECESREAKASVSPSLNLPSKEKEFPVEVKQCAENIITLLKKEKPDYCPPRILKPVEKSLDLMVRLDGRSLETCLEVLKWALSNDFWRANMFKINPADYLRKKFDTLHEQMKQDKGKSSTKNDRSNSKLHFTGEGTDTGWKRKEATLEDL